jgi:glutamate synthase (NADPH/NADH) small chain
LVRGTRRFGLRRPTHFSAGHKVTIFESKPTAGGLLVYGIPNFKFAKGCLVRKMGGVRAAGVRFIPNTYIGKDKTLEDLFQEGFEAVFIGVGSEIDAKMKRRPAPI